MVAEALSNVLNPLKGKRMPSEIISSKTVSSEIVNRADFSQIRYAQCWEDADILLDGLAIQPGDTCLSIASAGDNALAMLCRDAGRVIALDLNPAQLACLELRVAAYRCLDHPELLQLMGSRPSDKRRALYEKCCPTLSKETRRFWEAHGTEIDHGIGGAGKFERYFALFRQRILPLVHNHQRITQLLTGGDQPQREKFYDQVWNNWRWRALFKIFFSRFVMGRMGRDPGFFQYVEGSVAKQILKRTHYALTALNPADNPYLQWILTGQHTTALPLALREENFDIIRERLDRIEWHLLSLEAYLEQHQETPIHRYNLSDIFEYMSEDNYHRLLQRLIDAAAPQARLAYWNMLVPRHRPESMAQQLQPLTDLSQQLYADDKAFFYMAFIVEEVL